MFDCGRNVRKWNSCPDVCCVCDYCMSLASWINNIRNFRYHWKTVFGQNKRIVSLPLLSLLWWMLPSGKAEGGRWKTFDWSPENGHSLLSIYFGRSNARLGTTSFRKHFFMEDWLLAHSGIKLLTVTLETINNLPTYFPPVSFSFDCPLYITA